MPNIIDPLDAAFDEFIEEGGTAADWEAFPTDVRTTMAETAVANRIEEGYWFNWTDGTVRDWPEA
jgi:hypothetical protein